MLTIRTHLYSNMARNLIRFALSKTDHSIKKMYVVSENDDALFHLGNVRAWPLKFYCDIFHAFAGVDELKVIRGLDNEVTIIINDYYENKEATVDEVREAVKGVLMDRLEDIINEMRIHLVKMPDLKFHLIRSEMMREENRLETFKEAHAFDGLSIYERDDASPEPFTLNGIIKIQETLKNDSEDFTDRIYDPMLIESRRTTVIHLADRMEECFANLRELSGVSAFDSMLTSNKIFDNVFQKKLLDSAKGKKEELKAYFESDKFKELQRIIIELKSPSNIWKLPSLSFITVHMYEYFDLFNRI